MKFKSAALFILSILSGGISAAPPPMSPSTQTVTVTVPGTVSFPGDAKLLQYFASADRSTTAPWDINSIGYETDTQKFYMATGTSAGNWTIFPIVYTSGSYADPNFISSLAWSKIASTPSTLSGYGITDAVPNTRTVNGHALSADVTLSASDVGAAATASSNSFSGAQTVNVTGVGTSTSTPGFWVTNSTAATNGAQVQNSPIAWLRGNGWKTNTVAASRTVDWGFQNQVSAGTANPSGVLAFVYSVNGAAPTTYMSISSSSGVSMSNLSIAGSLQINGVDALASNSLDTDGTLAANSDSKIATQKAVKTYVDANAGGGGGTTIVRGSATLNGWSSYTPATHAVATLSVPDGMDDGGNHDFTVDIDGSNTVAYSFDNSGDPMNGDFYIGGSSGSGITDAAALASAITSQQGSVCSAVDNGDGTVTITANSTGSASTITGSSGSVSGADPVGPSGQVDTVTLISSTSGKTLKIVSLYAVADTVSSWNGELDILYGNGTVILSANLGGNGNGMIPLPMTGGFGSISNLKDGIVSQSLKARFLPTGSDTVSNFPGGTLTILAICTQE